MSVGRGTGFTLALLAVGVVFLAQTIGLSPTGRRVALPAVALVTLLLLVQLVRDARAPVAEGGETPGGGAAPTGPDDDARSRSPWRSLAWVLAVPAMIAIAGLCEGVGLHAFAFLRVRGKEPLPVAALGGLGVAALVWWIVGTLLGAELPGGLILATIAGG